MVRAALIERIGEPYVIRDIAVADPVEHEVLVEVRASGLCHSDLTIAQNDYGIPLPILQGHEVAGVVLRVGDAVRSIRVGEHVVACPVDFCGYCDQCLRGRHTACRNRTSLGRAAHLPPRLSRRGEAIAQLGGIGGFAEQVLVHENKLVSIDPAVPFDRAALLGCGVVTGAGAVINNARVAFGQTVAVIGCGGIGLNAVQAAALSGARRVIAIDPQPAKRELAEVFGATDTVDPNAEDPVDRVRALTGGHGVDFAFEAVGLVATLQQATRMLDHFGAAYVIGMQRPGTRFEVNVDPMDRDGMLLNEQQLRTVRMGATSPKLDIPLFADLYLQGRFNLDDLVSRTIPLDEINEGYEELSTGVVARTVVTF